MKETAVIFALLGAGVMLLVIALGPDPRLDMSDAGPHHGG